MPEFLVEVVIENKPLAKDPEGDTVCRDLINRGGYQNVKKVRTGKYLRFSVDAQTSEGAKDTVYKLCNDLRIFNPVVHTCEIKLKA